MTSPSIVRAAIPEDRDEIWRLFKLLTKEQFMFPVSEKKVDYHIERFINGKLISAEDTGPRGFIGVIGEVGKLEGIIMMSLVQYWYTDEFSVDEYFSFVDPAHRSSNHSKSLILYGTNIITELLPFYPELRIVVGILSVKRTAAKVRLYGQVMQPVGAFFTFPAIPEATSEPLRRLYKGH